MTKRAPPSAPKPTPDLPDADIHPDAWDRFERAVDTVMKSGPKHRPTKKAPTNGARDD